MYGYGGLVQYAHRNSRVDDTGTLTYLSFSNQT